MNGFTVVFFLLKINVFLDVNFLIFLIKLNRRWVNGRALFFVWIPGFVCDVTSWIRPTSSAFPVFFLNLDARGRVIVGGRCCEFESFGFYLFLNTDTLRGDAASSNPSGFLFLNTEAGSSLRGDAPSSNPSGFMFSEYGQCHR